jgi:pilus assembly protein CpaB
MASNRRPLLLVLALSSGGLAGLLALSYLREGTPAPLAMPAPVERQIVVAAQDVPPGTVLSDAHVKLVAWPATAPNGYASSLADVVGRGVITSLVADEPLLAAKLADLEAGGGLPIVIPAGMRAVSVKVDEVIGVAGFVLPGTRVDVLVTMRARSNDTESTTRLILQNVQTVTAGTQIEADRDGTPQPVTVVTLLVTPDQAESLTLAANEGRIHLALRNTMDGGEVKTSGADARRLLAGEPVPVVATPRPRPQPPAAPAPPPERVVEIYRGSARSEATFRGGSE